ncbi:SulP family inorganic anion transporter [Zeaxanthinibacter sp. PT1]|uniref:SulP family inorganic anion transporter n=1 Tax=Zeaxanthinibacter TaxID=561554 RepID=UPI00234ABF27|nr:SulP family inorganic anion transporter [Zeaxanthinibacter sp. PT1]MDC6350668.1 SulP family inorganic anion transporter [Zeaxanthinibacter sp. PT1]
MKKKNKFIKGKAADLPKNLFSGFVVSLIALPLGLGLALASEAPPISGIIAAVVGGTLVALLGGSNVTITGPGNGLVIVLLSAITTLGKGDLYQGYLFTLAAIVISGIIMVIMGFAKMGRLADFFPASAIEGMLAAIGLGILSKQFHIMIGNMEAQGSIVSLLGDIPASFIQLFSEPSQGSIMAAAIGIISLLILFGYPKLRNPYFHLLPAPMWILILSIGISYTYDLLNIAYPLENGFLLSLPDDVMASLAFPDFGKALHTDFILAVLAITLIASIESLLSIKAVDKLDPKNRRSNVNKDLKALGFATTVSGFLGGLNVVTVIARSSVNVNNGATDRSANLFHATFLLAFVLLFQEQLRKIPLAALAAILVYTGYKLATPNTFKKVARIGREQLLIFLATLLGTLFTNLITGITIGILTTFLIHVVVNRSLSLFLSHLIKPNILMYKESDGDNYYVSVKYFCSFLNFYRLKNKLDAIPGKSDVVLDFSLCNFVDDTVMEGLESYGATFKKKGGSLELIGLDKHETDSAHPFALRKILPFGALKPIENYFTSRQRGLQATAGDYRWMYKPEKQTDASFLSDFIFFRTREIRYSYNRIAEPGEQMSVFDLEFTEGAFIAREVIKTTAMHIELDHKIPVFTLDKEGLLQMLYGMAGFKDIDIDHHPDFNKRFYLSGEDDNQIRSMFTDPLVLFLESNPYYHVESNGHSLLIMKKERLLGVQEIKQMIYFGQQLRNLLQQAD